VVVREKPAGARRHERIDLNVTELMLDKERRHYFATVEMKLMELLDHTLIIRTSISVGIHRPRRSCS
jgi:hypothetical protein